jgi:hypothetical protein
LIEHTLGTRQQQQQPPQQQLQQLQQLQLVNIVVVPTLWWTCPNNEWSRRILSLASEKKSLAVSSAYVSTLGGGFFMCRFVNKAQEMARAQLEIAIKLGDRVLQSKCRTHLIYNDIQLGAFDVARAKLMQEIAYANELGNKELCSVVASALHFCERSREVNQKLEPVLKLRSDKAGDVEDEFYRIRVVQVDQVPVL